MTQAATSRPSVRSSEAAISRSPKGVPLHVWHVDPERGFSGGEVQVVLLIEGLMQKGHRCTVVTQPGSLLEAECGRRGWPVVAVPMRGDWQLSAVHRLTQHLRAAQPDLVHLHTGRANWLGGWAALRAGVPAVSTRRMDRRVRSGWKASRIYGRFVQRTAAISPAVLERLHEGGVAKERTELIWSVVNPKRLQTDEDRAQTRARLGIDPKVPLGLAMGALVERKGFDFLLRVFAALLAQDRDAGPGLRPHLCIAGDGPARDSLQQLAQELGLDGQVSWLGHCQEVGALLQASDLFLMPSRAEGLGISALEAMAAGLPVLASRVGGLADLVVDGECGRLLEPKDPGAWVAAWSAMLKDQAMRERCGNLARERVAERFLPEQMVAAYENFYLTACPVH